MFHDELMKHKDDLKQWHHIYGRLSDAVNVSLGKFLEVLKGVEISTFATGSDIHAVTQMLMYEFAESIDGVTILVRKGSGKNCAQLLRTAFEIALGLRYILEDGQTYERRSLAYEYYHLLYALKWAKKCDPENAAGKQLRKELEGEEFANLFDVEDKGIDIKKEVEKHEKRVNTARYALVRAEINRLKENKKKKKKEGKPFDESSGNWFSLWGGPKDVRSLSTRLKWLSFYEMLYRSWSNLTHGEGALKRLSGPTADGLVCIDPIRSPANLPDQCVHACNLTNMLTQEVVDKLVPQMRECLPRWYLDHMKPALSFVLSVKIKT